MPPPCQPPNPPPTTTTTRNSHHKNHQEQKKTQRNHQKSQPTTTRNSHYKNHQVKKKHTHTHTYTHKETHQEISHHRWSRQQQPQPQCQTQKPTTIDLADLETHHANLQLNRATMLISQIWSFDMGLRLGWWSRWSSVDCRVNLKSRLWHWYEGETKRL